MNRIASDGRAMEAHDGYGKTRTSKKPFGTSFRVKANLWKFIYQSDRRVPLLYSRGSVNFPAFMSEYNLLELRRYVL